MSIGQTPDGRWYCHFRDLTGKGCREYFGRDAEGKTAAGIRDLEIKLLKKRPRTEPALMALGAPTFQELSQSYINHRVAELAASTRREIISAVVNDALPVMGNKRAGEIDMKDLTAIEKSILDRGAAPQTVNRRVGYLSHIFSWAMERQIIRAHPWPHRKPLKTKRFRVELPELSDIRRIMEHAPDHLRWALEVEYHTGLRPGPSELFKLKWLDIDMVTGLVKIYSSKTDRLHYQYVSIVFRDRLNQRRNELIEKEELCEYVVSWRGAPIRSLKTVWGAAKRLAGITRPLRLYDIRHFYASHALVQGANILELAERLGHVNSEMVVKVYAHLADGIRSREPLRIPDLYAQNPLPTIDI